MQTLLVVIQIMAILMIVVNVVLSWKERYVEALFCADITAMLYLVAFIIVNHRIGF